MTESATQIALWSRLSATQKLMVRGIVLLASMFLLVVSIGAMSARGSRGHGAGAYAGSSVVAEYRALERKLEATIGELEVLKLELNRANSLLRYSARYTVRADLAELVYSIALREAIDPELAFRLVYVESKFNSRAVSSAGAVGLTQVLLSTGRFYEPELTLDQLMEPARNLRIGFRYLSDLLKKYGGDAETALAAYNRGPSRVTELIDSGRDPRNSYVSAIMSVYDPGKNPF